MGPLTIEGPIIPYRAPYRALSRALLGPTLWGPRAHEAPGPMRPHGAVGWPLKASYAVNGTCSLCTHMSRNRHRIQDGVSDRIVNLLCWTAILGGG